MPLSLAEIKLNAMRFSKEWATASRERADAQTFWNDFFTVFGRSRKLVATFEEPVKNLKGDAEFIDLFWPGTLIAEHKSRGKDLDKANSQAIGYIHNLANSNRAEESPRFIILSDFAKIALYDLEDDSNSIEFPLEHLYKHIRRFAFIAGYQTRKLDPEDPANFQAVQKLANLHDQLKEAHFTGHPLERFLVRILFCLFAEDTEIFEPESFKLFLLNHTKQDGSDLGAQLATLFQILDTPSDQRDPSLSDDLAAFPHVNGELFRETLRFPSFSSRQREALLNCSVFQWTKISPAIFGALFQDVMKPRERRQIGAHYTSESDIMKLIRSLFLDELQTEFLSLKSNRRQLTAFHDKITSLKFLDPACGCGNFLVITYRELRLLELEVLKALYPRLDALLNVASLIRVNVDQMYGIEIEEWPARIAEVALWLLDHQMNQLVSQAFGNHFARLPLRAAPSIRVGNALRTDWNEVLPHSECAYVLGNPPFVGKHLMTESQSDDMSWIWGETNRSGTLDYVTGWYLKAADYVAGSNARVAFVSTNSITQGEQVHPLWSKLFSEGMKIHFGHRTFAWESEARGKAHVHVVIVGFGSFNVPNKYLVNYEPDPTHPTRAAVTNISPYLTDGPDLAVAARRQPLNAVPACIYGSKPTDKGNLILENEDRSAFLAEFPCARRYIRQLLCADEYLEGKPRWCIWLLNANPEEFRACAGVMQRIRAVRDFRLASKKEPTRKMASQPSVFAEIRQPSSRYIVVPQHTSQTRRYVPFGFFEPTVIVHNSCSAIPNATLSHFGILSSAMHMAWVRTICGRIKSDYRYSTTLVYNNFPWPTLTDGQRARIEQETQSVLDARASFLAGGPTLGDLYDPLTMPKLLADAHRRLDLAVDRAYRPQPFPSDRHRFEFLFGLYERLTAPLTTPNRGRRSSR